MLSTNVKKYLAALPLLIGANNLGIVSAQGEPGMGFCATNFDFDNSAIAMTTYFQKTIPETCVELPDGTEGCFYTHIPESCASSEQAVPLVLDIHASQSCPRFHTEYVGWPQKGNEECFVVVQPIGTKADRTNPDDLYHNTCFGFPGFLSEEGNNVTAAPCCCQRGEELSSVILDKDDTAFLKMTIDTVLESFGSIAANANIDTALSLDSDRVYLAGHSNGCVGALSMAALYSDIIAGVACHAGTLVTPILPTYSPVPIWMVHGRVDNTIPYDGLSEQTLLGTLGFWSVDETRNYLAEKNNCNQDEWNESSLEGNDPGTTYTALGCDASVEIVTLDQAGHNPMAIPQTSETLAIFRNIIQTRQPGKEFLTTIDTTAMAWEFLSGQSLNKVSCQDEPRSTRFDVWLGAGDDELTGENNDKKYKPCSFMAGFRQNRLDKFCYSDAKIRATGSETLSVGDIVKVYDLCPQTCQACSDSCEDVNRKFSVGEKVNKKCGFMAKMGNATKKKFCNKEATFVNEKDASKNRTLPFHQNCARTCGAPEIGVGKCAKYLA